MGVGCVSAAGKDVDTGIETMFSGIRNPGAPTRFTTDHLRPLPVFEVNEATLPPGNADTGHLTLTARFGLGTALQALSDAGIHPASLGGRNVGVIMGTTVGCMLNNDGFYVDYRNGKKPGMSPVRRFLNSNPSGAIARYLKLAGPVQTVVNACASGSDAIGIGASWIRAGLCDLVIAGGTDELCKVTYNGFASLMIADAMPCKPFDKARNGLNLGEGAGVLILASHKGFAYCAADPKCRFSGYGTACDAYHLTTPAPDGRGLEKALLWALKESGIPASGIGFINAHGTGTKDNDRVEGKVLSKIVPKIPFLSTKGYTGHTLGAAGAVEAVFTVRHLLGGRIPASMGFENKDDEMNHSPVQEPINISKEAAISQSVAFGGNNSVLIFSKL
ncbi:MAG: beta-ketoacyl-[acyl-carrier-protein] synthase family protein [Desulfamplus sp.]|nr:beta-ketoacyl-[acyl-carrier-protein] synthase family protein [Desulfamplus sp.]